MRIKNEVFETPRQRIAIVQTLPARTDVMYLRWQMKGTRQARSIFQRAAVSTHAAPSRCRHAPKRTQP